MKSFQIIDTIVRLILIVFCLYIWIMHPNPNSLNSNNMSNIVEMLSFYTLVASIILSVWLLGIPFIFFKTLIIKSKFNLALNLLSTIIPLLMIVYFNRIYR
jgi:hypothetical protein